MEAKPILNVDDLLSSPGCNYSGWVRRASGLSLLFGGKRGGICKPRFVFTLYSLAPVAVVLLLSGAFLHAQTSEDSAAVQEEPALEVQAGFSGYWKLGHICPLRVRLSGQLVNDAKMIRVVSLDGDGVEVAYTKTHELLKREIWMPIRVGRKNFAVTVEVLGAAENVLQTATVSTDDGRVLGSDQHLVLALGASMGLEQLSRTNAEGAGANFSCITIQDASDLPPESFYYESCDLIVVSTSDTDFLKDVEPKWSAIDGYLRRGGGCILSAAATASEYLQSLNSSGLAELLPGEVGGVGRVDDPRVVESLISPEDPLGEFDVLLFESTEHAQLTLSDRLNRSTAWWTRFTRGHGTVSVIAADLDSEAFASWADRRVLWQLLVAPYLSQEVLENREAESDSGDHSYLGYNDLVGQLRATLDVFKGVEAVSFSQIAAILIGVLILIGPADYLLSVRWLRRPDLSWYFTIVSLCAVSAALAYYCLQSRPRGVLVNSVQIVDLDYETGETSGYQWAHVYSGNARTLDISSAREGLPVRLDWQGLPGNGLGALSSQLTTGRGMPLYRIDQTALGGTTLMNVGVGAGGTKCLFGEWQAKVDGQESALNEIAGVDQLAGDFQNPFEEEIRDAVLFYHNWYYRLNSRIPVGASVRISSETIPKDIARKLNERKSFDQKSTSTKWDPASRDSLDRLMELMMFHKAATGQNYTSLKHRYQGFLDQSNLLDSDKAILIGKLSKPVSQLRVAASGDEQVDVQQGLDQVWCRVIVPVSKYKKRN